jgi:hypothetical protein
MRRLSESEKVEIWDRFDAGESLRSISRQLGRPPSTIRTHVVSARFRRPLPAVEWSPKRLSFTEREEISRGLAADESGSGGGSGPGIRLIRNGYFVGLAAGLT